ncbi:MAG: DUF2330 domain-containing protein, partial [Polyangiales bacterium]
MSSNRFWALTLGLALAGAGLFAPARSALACGGFFCSANAPVNQAAERIIFAKNADGSVTAVVQIQYSGPSENFAWVLPVPGIPEVKVSSDLAFRRLQQASNPQYITTQVVEGVCDSGFLAPQGSTDSGGGGTGGGGGSSGGGVTVLASGNVGPYDFVVIQPEASSATIGAVAVDWLTNEGYDVVPPGGDPMAISTMLGSYLQGGMNLLAFRLTKGNSTGTIRPVRITYPTELPMIPIRPTAVAANDDMGVMVWVLGEARAIPVNYRSLELNEALIDWPRFGANYNQVVVAAADEAGGQGFVTERAGPASDYQDTVVLPFERDDWGALSMSADSLTSAELLVQSAWMFSAWDGYADVAERYLPDGVLIENFLNCPNCEQDLLAEAIDKEAFLDDLALDVVEPMLETQALLSSRPYVTRLYTTLSAPEMDLDPLFDFNSDLGDASNVHNATQVVECAPGLTMAEVPSRFVLEDGRVVRVAPGAPWPFNPGATEALPANSAILQLSTSGDGEILRNNAAAIDALLARHN